MARKPIMHVESEEITAPTSTGRVVVPKRPSKVPELKLSRKDAEEEQQRKQMLAIQLLVVGSVVGQLLWGQWKKWRQCRKNAREAQPQQEDDEEHEED
jgi:hypothetical protein